MGELPNQRIHLLAAISRLELLSLDSRIRESGRQLGFRLRPEAEELRKKRAPAAMKQPALVDY